ncbi:MAG TPA: MbtH family NRPS accessory protein [Kofleriaceae bacterium]|jgi:MbtH protein
MSTSILDDEDAVFDVVVNHEEQYSIWPADREPPAGWQRTGTSGKKAECLQRITELWTDMRPRSLRIRMAEAEVADAGTAGAAGAAPDAGQRTRG